MTDHAATDRTPTPVPPVALTILPAEGRLDHHPARPVRRRALL